MRCKARRPSPAVGSPAEGGPRSGPPFASSSLTRALVESERRALVVTAELEAAEPRSRLRVIADVDLLERAAQLAHLLDRGVDVVDGEEEVRARAPVAAVHAARHRSRDREAVAGAGLESPAEQRAVERAAAPGVLDAEFEERQLARHHTVSLRLVTLDF